MNVDLLLDAAAEAHASAGLEAAAENDLHDEARNEARDEMLATPYSLYWTLDQANAGDVEGLTRVTPERIAQVTANPFADGVTTLEIVAALLSCDPERVIAVRIALRLAVSEANADTVRIRASELLEAA